MAKYLIDQSGKIEQTSRHTILCLSNEFWDAVLIPAKVKRQLQEIFRRHGRIRSFILFTFAAGLAILLERNASLYEVVVDREYWGKEGVIKNIVLEMTAGKKIPQIRFAQIGKKALAHHRAYAVAIGKLKASKIISLSELLAKIKMTEVGKRLKGA